LRVYRCWHLLKIEYSRLIALAKCRQIASQMRPSPGRDAALDVPLFMLNAFDRL